MIFPDHRLTTFERSACEILLTERGYKAAERKAAKYQARHVLKSVRLKLFLALTHKDTRSNAQLRAAINGVFHDLDSISKPQNFF